MKNIHVAIADDHVLVLEGFKLLINKFRGITVVFTAKDGFELISKLEKSDTLPDLIILDLEMSGPGGGETLRELRCSFKELKILVLTTYTSPAHAVTSFRKGANGFITKDLNGENLEKAIRLTFKTGFYISPKFVDLFSKDQIKALKTQRGLQKELYRLCGDLGDIDMTIIELIARGKTSAEIAPEVNLTVRSVEGRRRRILKKTETSNSADLIRKAKELGWV